MISMGGQRILSSFGQHSSFWLKGSIEQKDDEKGKKWNRVLQKRTKRSSGISWLLKFSAEYFRSTLSISGASDNR
jgi:hypothetical protein